MTHRARRSPWSRIVGVTITGAVLMSACASSSTSTSSQTTVSRSAPRSLTSLPIPTADGKPPVYVHYYLWWTPKHWRDKLGPAYPYNAEPPPLPGSFTVEGCRASINFPGASVVDLPSDGLYDQNSPATLARDIATAASAGVRGFVVSWQGTGSATQTPSSSPFNTRLDLLVKSVDAYNATHAQPFNLALGLSAFGDYHRGSDAVVGDLVYFATRYAAAPAFSNAFSSKPLAMILDSRKFTGTQVRDAAKAVGTRLFLIGDDTPKSWSQEEQYLSGASWYWSSQNPYTNSRSGAQLESLAASAHAARKRWFAPFAPGFDARTHGGSSCTPRNGTRTLTTIWDINRRSQPDAWFGISWNEFVENTYLQPSRAYGNAALDTLRGLIARQ